MNKHRCLYFLKTTLLKALMYCIVSTGIAAPAFLHADPVYTKVIEITLGDYRYMPDRIQLIVGQPVILRLINIDSITPHTFVLPDASDGLDVDVDILAGETVDVHLMPLVEGRHTFYCKNKFIFMDSHRDKGMHGILEVTGNNHSK